MRLRGFGAKCPGSWENFVGVGDHAAATGMRFLELADINKHRLRGRHIWDVCMLNSEAWGRHAYGAADESWGGSEKEYRYCS